MPLLCIAIILRIVSTPITNVFQKKLAEKGHEPFYINFIAFFILGIICLVPGARVDWTQYPASFWENALWGGLSGALGNGLLVLALKKGELSVLGPINSFKSVIGLILGIFLLHEIPGLHDVLGIVLMIIGGYLVLETSSPAWPWRNHAVGYRIGAMFLTAIEAIFIKKVILYSNPLIAFCFWCWLGALFSLLFLVLQRMMVRTTTANISHSVPRLEWAKFRFYIGLVSSIAMMQYTTNYIFGRMNVGSALALFQISTLISVFFGVRFFHEEHFLHKMAGALVMIAGSVLILLPD